MVLRSLPSLFFRFQRAPSLCVCANWNAQHGTRSASPKNASLELEVSTATVQSRIICRLCYWCSRERLKPRVNSVLFRNTVSTRRGSFKSHQVQYRCVLWDSCCVKRFVDQPDFLGFYRLCFPSGNKQQSNYRLSNVGTVKHDGSLSHSVCFSLCFLRKLLCLCVPQPLSTPDFLELIENHFVASNPQLLVRMHRLMCCTLRT